MSFSVSVVCSQILTLKFTFMSKIGLTYAIFIVKECSSKKIFFLLFFFAEFELFMFHKNIVKISQNIEQAEFV